MAKMNSTQGLTRETLEQRRLRLAQEQDEAERVARLRALKGHHVEGVAPTDKDQKVKLPLTLNLVYDTFIKRIKHVPIKVMRSEERDPFGRAPRVLKIEARFLNVPASVVMAAMKGLDVRSPVSRVKDMSYTHMALWGHKGKELSFRVSMYRYRDKSVLFIFTPEYPE